MHADDFLVGPRLDEGLFLGGDLRLHGGQFGFCQASDFDPLLRLLQLLPGNFQRFFNDFDLAFGQRVIPVRTFHLGGKGFGEPAQFVFRHQRIQTSLPQIRQIEVRAVASEQRLRDGHAETSRVEAVLVKGGIVHLRVGFHGKRCAGRKILVQENDAGDEVGRVIFSVRTGSCQSLGLFLSDGNLGANPWVERGPFPRLPGLPDRGVQSFDHERAVVLQAKQEGFLYRQFQRSRRRRWFMDLFGRLFGELGRENSNLSIRRRIRPSDHAVDMRLERSAREEIREDKQNGEKCGQTTGKFVFRHTASSIVPFSSPPEGSGKGN